MSGTTPETIASSARNAFTASQIIPDISTARVNALETIRKALEEKKDEVLRENEKDVEAAKELVASGSLSSSLLGRLSLSSSSKYDLMLQGISDVAKLPDPTGEVTYANRLDDGLDLYRITCPVGVVLCVFESRPEVMVNIAALAIKSGNAAILKGGRESSRTVTLLSNIISTALSTTPFPPTYIQSVTSRSDVTALLSQDKYIDLVIPRGGGALVKSVKESTKIPVMGHAEGICSVFVDQGANEETAERVVIDSKTTYQSACNSLDQLLLHPSQVQSFWPRLASTLASSPYSITLLCDPPSLEAFKSSSSFNSSFESKLHPSKFPDDYQVEHLGPTLSVRVVEDVQQAIQHVNSYSSHHTDCIVTQNDDNAKLFSKGVDSAGVFVNASTRFSDGFRYGFGTEVGIATGKWGARGPVGLDGLVIYKYQLRSTAPNGHTTSEFGLASEGKKPFKHEKILGVKEAPF